MKDHRWLGDVIADLAQYCSMNQMEHTAAIVRDVQLTFQAELAVLEGISLEKASDRRAKILNLNMRPYGSEANSNSRLRTDNPGEPIDRRK